jgi:hypothetical protein
MTDWFTVEAAKADERQKHAWKEQPSFPWEPIDPYCARTSSSTVGQADNPACDCCPHTDLSALERDVLTHDVWDGCPDSGCLWRFCPTCQCRELGWRTS